MSASAHTGLLVSGCAPCARYEGLWGPMCENKDIMDHLNAVEQLGALLSHPGCRAPGGDAARVEISSAPLRDGQEEQTSIRTYSSSYSAAFVLCFTSLRCWRHTCSVVLLLSSLGTESQVGCSAELGTPDAAGSGMVPPVHCRAARTAGDTTRTET